MKTFNDLKFKKHKNFHDCEHALLEFENGYGVSVVTGNNIPGGWTGPHASPGQYEIAILKDGALTYETRFTDDVLKYQSKADLKRIIKEVQEL